MASHRTAQRQGSGARRASYLRAWSLLLLLTLLRVLSPALCRRVLRRWSDSPGFLAAFAPDAPCHAAHVALGLLRDWILRCLPNEGMHPTPVLRPRAPRPRPTRDPPRPQGERACPAPRLKSPPPAGAIPCPFCFDIAIKRPKGPTEQHAASVVP
jgi:hypothetical protein